MFKLSGKRPEILSMKTLCALLFLSVFGGISFAQTNEDELKEIMLEGVEYSLDAAYETGLIKDNNQKQVDLFNLQKAKFKMISGDLKTAEYFLNRISDKTSGVTGIKKRYLAVLHFINGRFDKSLKELNQSNMESTTSFTQNCLLRLINFMAVNDVEAIKRERAPCQFYTAKYSKNDQYWLNSMIQLKTQNSEAIRRSMYIDAQGTFSSDEMARLWLKTGLYLNKEKDLLNLISTLPESSYQSKRLREIVAFMYLRSGDSKKALAFIDDIDTANAENIKGNVNLANKEYELAFGHFRLALQKKQDSANSLERAIPLAWLLNQWTDGLLMLNNISNKSLDPRNASAVKIAFLIREKKFTEAQKELTLLKIAFKYNPPFEVNVMDTYVNLILGGNDNAHDKRKVEESAEKSCKSFDGISCWLSLQYIQWGNLGKTIKRDEEIYTDKVMTVESLKEKKGLEPLIEIKTIDQADIEELDGETIRLSPQ